MIEIINLKKRFILGKTEIPVLRGISFKIEKGEFVCLCGPSGSGKSTILNLIGGLDRPTDGKIIVDNLDINNLDENQLAVYRQDYIGFVFQSYNLIPTLSVFKNIEIPLIFSKIPPKSREEKIKFLLDKIELSHRIAHRPIELSGGEQQRVAIARALINNPKIVLADEPTGNLDTKTGEKIIELLISLNRERNLTMLIVTHNLEIAKIADRIIRIRDGKLE